MGIHYDYKSIRGEKAMKKEAKKKARLEERRARRNIQSKKINKKNFILINIYSNKIYFSE